MGEYIHGGDLDSLRIEPGESGAFFVSARCPLCLSTVSLRLNSPDAEMHRESHSDCRSGQDWPESFQLFARFSPSETDHDSGVDVWGVVE